VYLINIRRTLNMAITSLLIPTRAALIATRYTPAELAAVTAIDAFFLDDEEPLRLAFITALWTAYAAGATTLTHEFGSYADAAAAKTFLEDALYGYTVAAINPPDQVTLTVSWA
jgi:hypothetical protein